MTFARGAYSVVAFLAMPFALLYLLWRSRRQPEYRSHWAERFGFARYPKRPERPLIWIHAVSLGETRAAEPLINALATAYPRHDFLLTHMTPTGRAAGAEIAARITSRVLQTYLPYDLPYAVRRFLRAFQPVLGISVETEAWPNLVATAAQQGMPMALVNGRLSERSYRRSLRYASLMRETAARFSVALAQTQADADRIRRVGATEVEVTGNLKFDFTPDAAQVARGTAWRHLLVDQGVLLFASTRDGEEALILDALDQSGASTIVIVPRHPQRFDEVAGLLESRGLPYVRRSESNFETNPPGTFVLGDSMGEMTTYYAAADVAFIGGSLLSLGGQNLIEACAVGTPVVIGPHTFNFEQATDDAIAAGAAKRVANARDAVATMLSIAKDRLEHQRMSKAAEQFASAHRGATARTVARLASFIGAASARPDQPVATASPVR